MMDSLPPIAIAVLAIGVLLLVIGANMGAAPRDTSYHRRHYNPRPVQHQPVQHQPVQHQPVQRVPGNVPDAADQLRAVENAPYGRKPLLRFQESQVFAAAEVAVREAGVPWRVFAQVSLGEVLTCTDREGFNAINAKRVDLLLTDANFTPLAAIEYQGSGHHLSPAAARDAVKKEALRKAGIGYIEITHADGPEDVRREISRLAFVRARSGAREMRRVVGG